MTRDGGSDKGRGSGSGQRGGKSLGRATEEGEGEEKKKRITIINDRSPLLMQPLSKIPQVPRIIVNLIWFVLQISRIKG